LLKVVLMSSEFSNRHATAPFPSNLQIVSLADRMKQETINQGLWMVNNLRVWKEFKNQLNEAGI